MRKVVANLEHPTLRENNKLSEEHAQTQKYHCPKQFKAQVLTKKLLYVREFASVTLTMTPNAWHENLIEVFCRLGNKCNL
mmetsp:Transcript_4883/g.8578  ORF Transcript_4883/g.8578 Transcript_4883/m.8578 type:complete len:80 (+) Transcript_4883:1455-1694(+)